MSERGRERERERTHCSDSVLATVFLNVRVTEDGANLGSGGRARGPELAVNLGHVKEGIPPGGDLGRASERASE